MRRLLPALAAAGLLMPAAAKGHAGCHDAACKTRVEKRAAHAKWRPVVRAYGIALLRARMRCESGGDGGYALSTTGNGFWFSMQWEPRAWTGAGGRMRHGRPAGVWTMQPSRLEQNFRAVRWDAIHGGDPWPRCP